MLNSRSPTNTETKPTTHLWSNQQPIPTLISTNQTDQHISSTTKSTNKPSSQHKKKTQQTFEPNPKKNNKHAHQVPRTPSNPSVHFSRPVSYVDHILEVPGSNPISLNNFTDPIFSLKNLLTLPNKDIKQPTTSAEIPRCKFISRPSSQN